MKYSYKDFRPDASAELPSDARASLQDKVAALEKEVADLKVDFGSLKADFKSLVTGFDFWFKEHLARLASDAAADFAQEFKEPIQQAVEKTFDREANELAKVIFEALVAKIQPYALKQRCITSARPV